MNMQDLENRFASHPADTNAKREAHAKVRGMCLALAEELNDLLPEGREKSLAITHLEETMFWSNAGIARQTEE